MRFCPDEFWNASVSWNTDTPRLSQCFEFTILAWLPAFILVLFTVAQKITCRTGFNANDDDDASSIKPYTPFWSPLFIWKTSFAFILVGLKLVRLIFNLFWPTVFDENAGVWLSTIGILVEIAGLIFAIAVITHERRLRHHTSGPLFCYFLLNAISHAMIFYNALRKPTTALTATILSATLFAASVAEFIPHIFADTYGRHKLDAHECPVATSSFISRVTFTWMSALMLLGWRRPLVVDDLWTPLKCNRTDFNVNAFEAEWLAERLKMQNNNSKLKDKKRKPSVFLAAYRTISKQLWLGIVFMLLDVSFSLASPQILKLLMNFVDDPTEFAWKGYFYSAALFATAVLQSVCQNQCSNVSYTTGMNLRSSLMAAIYRKALRISNDARRNVSVGEMVNLMSIDAQRVLDFMVYFYYVVSSPLLLAGATYFLWQELGAAALASLAVMLCIIPVSMTGRWQTRYLLGQMKWKDERIRIMSEVLSGIKVLKLYAWEQPFINRIARLRQFEIKYLLKAGYLQASMSFFFHLLPYAASLAGFSAFVLASPLNVLTAQKAFVTLTLFNIVRPALGLLPAVVTNLIQLRVSLKRLTNFLMSGENQDDSVAYLPAAAGDVDGNAIVLQNATFSWSSSLSHAVKPELNKINLNIKSGQLVAVVGQVGAGKTSLCSALLGLMRRQAGSAEIRGSVTYVPQQPWIQHMSVQQNILFESEMHRRRYQKVIRACALESDLRLLPAGDATEIGEKGLNLSGGQKQRVSLARAAYGNADVILLDDPLSAVDSHVAKHIFQHLLSNKTGLLRNKTRILITHNVSFLPYVDQIIVMDAGRITESGTYRQLIEKGGVFAQFLNNYVLAASEEEQAARSGSKTNSPTAMRRGDAALGKSRHTSVVSVETRGGGGKPSVHQIDDIHHKADAAVSVGELVATEMAATGSIALSVYTTYLRAAGYGLSLLLIVWFFMWNIFSVGNSIWLSEWSSDAQRYAPAHVPSSQTNYRLAVYGGLGGAQAVFMLLSSFFIVFITMRATAKLHESMLARVMHAPMSFFDTTPSGRLLNRFSKDVDAVDIQVPRSVRLMLVTLFYVISIIITICYSAPLFMIAVVPLALFYAVVQRFYACATRQLRRLESIARSPIYSLFSETISGQAVIMASQQQLRFVAQNERNIDATNIAYFPYIQAQRWLTFLLGLLSAMIVLAASLFALFRRGDGSNSSVASSMIGLAISNALMITAPLNLVVSSAADVEMSIVSAERIDEYSRTVPQEADWTSASPPASDWPQKGEIEFVHYATRYRPELELVLADLNAHIEGGERLGIVGRTGAGKSSLALALFRIVEAAQGAIIIDGVNIADIGLHELRSRLAIIPQDPVLFSGTLRSNLDPAGQNSDSDIWRALEQAHLKQWVALQPSTAGSGLEMVVQEEGQNLSVGQRQLICLARALLRKSRVLVLDEATAAIDVETDELIQNTIRSEFRDSTVLTVAHRLNTILDYDRVVVLAKGRVKEFDSPRALLFSSAAADGVKSEFARMVSAANITQDRINDALDSANKTRDL